MIDNEFYKHLGKRWFTSEGDAVALLRLENETKAPWVAERIAAHFGGTHDLQILDVGCGGGFLCHYLAGSGFAVTGMDVDERVLVGAGRSAGTSIDWRVGRAEALPFGDRSYDVVCVMDVLEHVDDPRAALFEAVRVLRPGGLLLFHTFNRTWPAWLLAAKGLDWFIKDSQAHIHDWRLFLKPAEVEAILRERGWRVAEWRGIRPRVGSALRLIFTRRVPADFAFCLSRSRAVGYLGGAVKSS